MPLFNKKFESKPIPTRTGRCSIGCPAVTEEIDDYKSVSLSLGNKELRFVDGVWIHYTRKNDVDDVMHLKRRLRNLEEQNNMANLKLEVLLDLLAEHATELQAMQVTEKLKKQ